MREILKTHENGVVSLEEKCPRAIHNFEGKRISDHSLYNYKKNKNRKTLPNRKHFPCGDLLYSLRHTKLSKVAVFSGLSFPVLLLLKKHYASAA